DVKQDSGTVQIAWEKMRVKFQIDTDTNAQALANIQKALAAGPKDWEVPYDAAQFAFTNNLAKEDAMKWVDQSISLKTTYWNLRLKADMLAQSGNKAEAIATAEKAIKLGKDNKDDAGEVAKTEKKLAEWKGASGSK